MARSKSKITQIATQWRPRHRPLLVFNDQGSPQVVPPWLFGLKDRDASWSQHAHAFLQANQLQFDQVEVQSHLVGSADGINLWLKPGGMIGAIPLRAPDTWKIAGGLVVRPRFGWNDIGPLLHRIGWSASPEILHMPFVPGSAREVPPWVLAGPMLQRFGRLLKEIKRGFRMHEEVRQIPRGQILWHRYISQYMTRGEFHHFPCRFPDLGPDALLRAYLRWGLERLRGSLARQTGVDAVARILLEDADRLLFEIRDIAARVPDRQSLHLIVHSNGLPSEAFREGLEALAWIVDERGLGGLAEMDGIAWRLSMHQLFERWIEHLVKRWTHAFGGHLFSARKGQTIVPIPWARPTISSLTSLVPDIVVRRGTEVFVFDAKYKGHFDELDERRWAELSEELRADHRHDVHQVVAYSALFESTLTTTALVYPVPLDTWKRLSEQGRVISIAMIASGGRPIRLALVGVPLQLDPGQSADCIIETWGRVFESQVVN